MRVLGGQFGDPGPILLAGDTFTRATVTTPPGAIETGTLSGTSWTYVDSWGINGNQLYCPTGGSGFTVCYANHSEPDVDITVDITAAPTQNSHNAGMLFRYVDTNNWWRWLLARNASGVLSWNLQKYVAASITTVATGTPSSLTGTLRIVASGSDIEAFLDGASLATTTDSTHNTATRHGFIAAKAGFTSVWRWDNYEAYTA